MKRLARWFGQRLLDFGGEYCCDCGRELEHCTPICQRCDLQRRYEEGFRRAPLAQMGEPER